MWKMQLLLVPIHWIQAIADGVLVEVFKNRWEELSGGKPIVATAHLFNEVNLAGLMENRE